MLVKFIKPHFKYSYFPGDEGEVDSGSAKILIAQGYAEPIEERDEKPDKPAKSNEKGK